MNYLKKFNESNKLSDEQIENWMISKKKEVKSAIDDISDAVVNLQDMGLIGTLSIKNVYKEEFGSKFILKDVEVDFDKFFYSHSKTIRFEKYDLSELKFEIILDFNRDELSVVEDLTPILKEIVYSSELLKSLNYDTILVGFFGYGGGLSISVMI